ncbi:class I SAM-dependent methyltransferase [Sagittula sp. M10.9X]|uniref:Class I SAM-dependent methyltransferase n=1 Tax=Sagittula salina TaxID=2820268 RepID=A0A940RZP4_9RHOB|nr:class I SAM-dependent methyltransferase [Sagittula salina]
MGLYQRNASAWGGLRGAGVLERAWLDRFLAVLPCGSPRVLDLGCGSGVPVADYLIANGCRICGVDAAPAMLCAARQRFPGHKWVEADMRALPPLGRFDGIVAWHSAFHLPPEDQRRMFAVYAALCRPGAPLMFTSGTECDEVIGDFRGEPLYHASLDSAEYRSLLLAHGFGVLRHIENDGACGGATVWLAHRTGKR